MKLGQMEQLGCKPAEYPLNEWSSVFLNTDPMSDDQLVEVPRKQLLERLPRQLSIGAGPSDIAWHAARRITHARKFPESISYVPAPCEWMILDKVGHNDRARFPVKERRFFDEAVSPEDELIEVICPTGRRHIG
jgi:hypothetical protein